jgi:rubrerythrin
MSEFAVPTLIPARRTFLHRAGVATLSATAVALLAGRETLAQGMGSQSMGNMSDVNILNTALGLEHEAINAYQLGAESGLLQKPALDVAVSFQSQHKEHRDALVATIKKLGGSPVAEKSKADYAKALNAASLKSQTDVLRLAQRLERGAANAYIGVIPSFQDKMLAQVSARLAADETMHWTALSSVLGDQLPAKALTFGA